MKSLFLASAVVAALTWPALPASAQSQTAAVQPPGRGPGPGSQIPGAPSGANVPEIAEQPWPVLAVTSVEIVRTTKGAATDIVRVTGLASSGAWTAPQLVPLTRGAPADGMLDLIFLALPPADYVKAEGYMEVDSILPIAKDHPYKGIRVRSATNALTLKTVPGSAEGKGPGDDCGKCVGKVFVARGASAPAGVAAADLVKEESLPPMLRIIKPTDGIALLEPNPNRLTLVLSEDGRIADAVWN